MIDNTKYICGLPGFGSSGDRGDIGLRGSSFHIIDSSVDLKTILSNEHKYNENDIFIYNNKLCVINKKTTDNNPLISEKCICTNPINDVIGADSSHIYINSDLLLSNNIKTKNQLNHINTNSPLTLIDSSSYTPIISFDGSIFLEYNNLSYHINNSIIANDLYLSKDSGILTEMYGVSELKQIIANKKYIDGKCKFDTINNNSKYRVTCIKNKDNNTFGEYLLKDFDDNNDSFVLDSDAKIYKVYYSTDYNSSNGCNIITETFTVETLKLLSCKLYKYKDNNKVEDTSSNIIISNNNIKILYTDDAPNNENYYLELSFIKGSNIDNSNETPHIVELQINLTNNSIYKLCVGNIVYVIEIIKLINEPETPELIFEFKEDKNGYLDCNKNNDHGVPLNGIMQVYSLDFIKFDNSSTYDISINITSSLENKPNILEIKAYKDCSLYYKIVKTEKPITSSKIKKVHNDTYVYLKNIINDDADSNCVNLDFNVNNLLNETSFDISFDKNKLDAYNIFDNTSSYKLVLYYEFNEPFYNILKTDIDCKIRPDGNDEKMLSYKTSKKTLMIPWEITGFVPKLLNSSTNYNLSIKNTVKCYSDIYPENLKSLKISPEINNTLMQFNTSKKYKYINIFDNLLVTSSDIYANDAFLSIAYNIKSDTESEYISYYNIYGKQRTSKKINFAQIKNKFPVWVGGEFNILINKNQYEYDSDIIFPSGTIYSPQNIDDFMIDLNTSKTYEQYNKNYYINNDFIGFVEWSIHTKTMKINDKEVIQKYPFSDINNLPTVNNEINNNYNTLYSLYWNVSPRIVQASKEEIKYDYAINMLKIPKVQHPLIKKSNYVASNETVRNVFNMHEYIKPISQRYSSIISENEIIDSKNALNSIK